MLCQNTSAHKMPSLGVSPPDYHSGICLSELEELCLPACLNAAGMPLKEESDRGWCCGPNRIYFIQHGHSLVCSVRGAGWGVVMIYPRFLLLIRMLTII